MQYACVTGADHGVGLALVKQLAERGWFVAAVRRDPQEKQVDALAEQFPGQIALIQADIGKDESVAWLKQQAWELLPQIDLLMNVAGILGDMTKTVEDELDFDEMLQVINVNALGTLRVTNALIGLVMKSSCKCVVNISSEAGSIGDCRREGWFGYCMSKAANNMQSALVYNHIRKDGGRVLAIHPGHVATYMRGHLDTTAALTPEQSAEGILRVVLEQEHKETEHPLFLDYRGEELPW